MATYSPNAVREQSLQNLSEMSRLVDKLYERAKTPAARQSLTEISKALSSIRPSGIVPPQTLEVENLLREVLRAYNQQFDEQKTDDIAEATMKVIREIVATRQKMCDCTMDMDEKRGFKSYYKAHKGEASKKEIKQAYKERYANAKSEADRYVIKANKLRQSVGSYKNTMGGFEREKLTKEVEAKIAETNAELRQLQVQYRQTTDRAVRARLNRRAGVLAKKKNALEGALTRIQLVGDQEDLTEVDAINANLGMQLEQTRAYTVGQRQQMQEQVKTDVRKEKKADQQFMEEADAMDSEWNGLTDYLEGANDDVLGSMQFDDMADELDDVIGSKSASKSEEFSLDDLKLD